MGGVHRAPSNIPVDAIGSPEQKPVDLEPYGGSSRPPMSYTTYMEPPGNQIFQGAPGENSAGANNGLFLNPSFFDERPHGFQSPYAASAGMEAYAMSFGGTSEAAPYSGQKSYIDTAPIYPEQPTDSTDTGTPYSQKKGRHKSMRQQQLNKLAQQRYR